MRELFNNWRILKEPDMDSLCDIGYKYEAYMEQRFKEEFPELDDDDLEVFSRHSYLNDRYSEAHKRFHKQLYQQTCRCCIQPLKGKYYECEGYFSQPIHLCEHCHGLILIRERIEELFESILKEMKKDSDDKKLDKKDEELNKKKEQDVNVNEGNAEDKKLDKKQDVIDEERDENDFGLYYCHTNNEQHGTN